MIFREEGISIFAQLGFIYRQNNIHCMLLSSLLYAGGKHHQRSRIIADPTSGKLHL